MSFPGGGGFPEAFLESGSCGSHTPCAVLGLTTGCWCENPATD